MDILKAILKFFGLVYIPKEEPAVEKEPETIILTENSQKLLEEIENAQLKDLTQQIYFLSVTFNNFLVVQRQQQDLLNHIATLHEELLYQLDQGKIVMMKAGVAPTGQQEKKSSFDVDELLSDTPGKKKENLN